MSLRTFLSICVVLCLVGVHCQLIQDSVYDDLWTGEDLSSEEAEILEEKLVTDPHDVTSRTQLLGYYWYLQSRRDGSALAAIRRHVLWLVRTLPDAAVLGQPQGIIDRFADPEGYSEGKKCWMDQLQRDPDNVTILGHAAEYLDYGERKTKIALLQRAQSLDPSNAEWPERLGREHSYRINRGSPEASKEAAEKALLLFEKAYELSGESRKTLILEELAKTAYEANQHEKARQFAESMLQRAGEGRIDGNLVHHGNLVLGRIALAEGNVKAAKFRLVAAGNTPSESNLSTFGPNMTLAKELLEKSEREVVLKYFRLCSRFWDMNDGRLEEWAALVEEGKIPDFGANLVY